MEVNQRSIVANNVVQHIEYYKICKPSIYNREIQENLINDGVCTVENVPSLTSIHNSIKNDLGYTFKNLTSILQEKEWHVEKQDAYVEEMTDINPANVHFFDEYAQWIEPQEIVLEAILK
jgi:hypothetical protein